MNQSLQPRDDITPAQALKAIEAMLRRDGVPEHEIELALEWAQNPIGTHIFVHPRTGECGFKLRVREPVSVAMPHGVDQMTVLNHTPIVAVYPIDPKYSEKRPNVCYCPAEYRPHTHVREGIDGMTNCCPLPNSGVGNCECGCVDVDQCGCECSFHINDDEEMGSQ